MLLHYKQYQHGGPTHACSIKRKFNNKLSNYQLNNTEMLDIFTTCLRTMKA